MEMEESSPSPLSPSEMLACSRGPLSMERRLRPPHDQLALKCPRCESTHTKFCYYNNYSLSQPRYFCKTCRRYWTKGGTLRNIPVGGGCRKNTKKASSSSSSSSTSSKSKQNENNNNNSIAAVGPTADLQLSFPDQVQFSHHHHHLSGLIGHHHHHHHVPSPNPNPNHFLPIEFLESKLEGIVGNSLHRVNGNFDFMGSGASGGGGVDLGMVNLGNGNGNGNGTTNNQGLLFMDHNSNFHNTNICAPFGMSLLEAGPTNNGGGFSDTCQRMMLPYEGQGGGAGGDVKPSAKSLLSLEWQQEQQGCSNHDHHVGNYLNGFGNWPGVINNYGPSTTNSLV